MQPLRLRMARYGPRLLRRCCSRCRLPSGLLLLLLLLLALGALAAFLVCGGHEEVLSRALLPLLAGRPPAPPDSLPGPTTTAAALPFVLEPAPEACAPRPPFVLVLVASAPGHVEQRRAVRATWGGPRWAGGYPTQTFFALGLPRDGEAALQAALEREAAQHGDLVQGRFLDTYANLTLKTLALLDWALSRCAGATFIIKADDDVFLNLPALAQHLATLASPLGTYLGRLHWRVPPNRDPTSRHHVPAALYAPATFPPYCSGTAYVLSGDAAAALLGVARHMPLLPVEDAFIGLCAWQAGIVPRHLARMAGSAHCPPDLCCYREILFSIHAVAPSQMLEMWQSPGPPAQVCTWLQGALGLLRCKALAWLVTLQQGLPA